MIEELRNASKLLSAALDQYTTACSATVTGYGPYHAPKSVPQETSDTITKELEIIASYHTKLTHAQAMVSRTKNNISGLTPINMLPHDILSYIFQLVHNAQPDYLDKDSRPFSPAYPETLTYVCSHWRRIAIETRRLWSHIHISDSHCTYSNHARLLARAKLCLARADPSPVDIRMLGGSHGCYDSGLNEVFASVATRIRSFDLSAGSFMPCISVLQNWLTNCKPGTLNKLVLKRSTCNGTDDRIEASEAPISSTSLLLEMPHEYLEERLRPVKVLQLTGVYFHWESQAYHGLVDLRLFPVRDGENLSISHSRLKEILTASPRLRELHFGLQITDVLPHDSHAPVNLDDLEVVNMCSMRGGHYGPLLQLLAPGPKPLQLSMNCRLTSLSSFPGNEAVEFCARANLAKLHIESFDTEDTGRRQPLVLLELLRHVPSLRALSLRCFYLGYTQPGVQPQDGGLSSHVDGTENRSHLSTQLDVVHLRDCTIDLDCLRRVIQAIPVQKLKYKGCRFYSMVDGYSDEFTDPQPRDNLPAAFSHVSSSWPMDESDPWA